MDKVLFISLDAFRKDNLTRQFMGVDCAPFLKGLKTRSVFYDNYRASCNWTIPSYASMFTGLPTVGHNFWSHKEYPKRPKEYVFDLLVENGVRPGIMLSGGMPNSIMQFNSDKYFASEHNVRDVDETVDTVISKLAELDFLFLHSFAQHDYLFHTGYMPNRYGVRRPYRFIGSWGARWMGRKVRRWAAGKHSLKINLKTIRTLERMYYNECMMADAFVEALCKEVVRRYPDIKIIVNSDHGECFSHCGKRQRLHESGELLASPLMGHGSGQCWEQFDVFLMLHDPCNPAQSVVDTRIDHEDIYDLILSLYGLGEFPRKDKERHQVSIGYDIVGNCGINEGDDFYIFRREEDGSLRYLMHDNLYSDEIRELTNEEKDRYRLMIEDRMHTGEETMAADEETMEQLRALGYLD